MFWAPGENFLGHFSVNLDLVSEAPGGGFFGVPKIVKIANLNSQNSFLIFAT